MGSWRTRALTGAAVLLAWAGPADAHIIGARLGDFYAGAAHPLSDLQDVLLWVGLGLLAGAQGPSAARPLVLLFPLGLLAGLGLHMATNVSFDDALAAAGILLMLGLLLATELRVHRALLCAIAIGLAVMRGASNASATTQETNILLFAAGLAFAGYVTITLFMAATVQFKGDAEAPAWRRIAMRALGSWIAAIGLMMGGLAFAPLPA